MGNTSYLKIELSCLESDLFHEKKFDKLHAWLDLISLALTEDKEISVRGITVQGKKGCAYVSRRMLAERWGWSEMATRTFLAKLEVAHKIAHRKDNVISCISVDNYDGYLMKKPTEKPTDSSSSPQISPQNSPQNSCISNTKPSSYNSNNIKSSPQISPQNSPLQEKENKETEKRKKKSPVPPIKEINKEKEKKERELPSPPNVGEVSRVHTCACEESNFVLTPETPAEEKKPTKKNSEEEYTLTYRARLTFDDFYKSKYGEAYYFSKKDMKMLSELLKKIKYSRTKRTKPLSVDDDSLLSAFKELLSMIQTKWIIDNFSISNITSKYNEIVQDIKNNRNGKSNCTTEQERNRLDSERQRAAIMANVKKLDEQREQWIKAGKPESQKSERQLPGYDPFDFL